MKTNLRVLLLSSMICLIPISGICQRRPLSAKDKSEIVRLILRGLDLSDSEKSKAGENGTVYFLDENISERFLPRRKGLTFKLLNKDQLEELEKTGVRHWWFSSFKRVGKRVEVTFGNTYWDHSKRYGAGNSQDYSCRKVSGNWRCRPGEPSAWVAESFK